MLPRLALVLHTLIAAGTFVVAKDATARFSPQALVWFRIVFSGVLMAGLYFARHRRLPPFTRGEWGRIVLLGLTGVTLNQGLFLTGLGATTPLHASLLYAFTPVMVLLAAVLWLGETWSWLRFAGVISAVTGVTLLLAARGLDLGEGPLRGDLVILVAVAAWSAFTLLGKSILRHHGALTVIAAAFVTAALEVLPLGPWVLRGFDPAAPGAHGWLDIAYLSVATSAVAFTLWYWALGRLEASQTAVFSNLQAPVTALLVWLLYGDTPGFGSVLGGLLVIAGVSLTQRAVRLPRARRVKAAGTG